MRGRKPRSLRIVPHDAPILQEIVRRWSLPWYQIQRARIVLGVAAGEPIQLLAVQTRHDPSTIWRVCRRHEDSGLSGLLAPPQRTGRPARFPPSSAPRSWNWPAWSRSPRGSTSPIGRARTWRARRSRRDRPVPQRSDVRLILDEVDLQPHRTRYWRTARLDAEFKRRAEKILWCYANAERLARRGFWVVCVDEKPNLQVLERCPIRRSSPARSSTRSSSTLGTARSTSWRS